MVTEHLIPHANKLQSYGAAGYMMTPMKRPVLSEAAAVAFGLDRADRTAVRSTFMALTFEERSLMLMNGRMELLAGGLDAAQSALKSKRIAGSISTYHKILCGIVFGIVCF